MKRHRRETNIQNITKPQPEKAKVIRTTYQQQLYRVTQDLAKWRSAVNWAESTVNPKRVELIRGYNDAVIDNHLSALMTSRKNKVLSREWGFYDKSGQKIEELDRMVDSDWFIRTLDYALDSIFWGYSLIQFGEIVNDNFTDIELVRREYVCPERSLVLNMPTSNDGVSYYDRPYSDWCLFIGQKYDLGLLMKAVPMVIYKKFSIGNWSEFSEVFGMPYKEGHTNVRDPELMANMQKALSSIGSNAYGIFDIDDRIEFIQTSSKDAFQVFDKLVERANSEMSKLILGQTGTTDMGKNRGSDDVHENVADEYGKRDEWFLRNFVNGQFVPFMKNLGIAIPEDANFRTEQEEGMDLASLGNMVVQLLKEGDVDRGYIEKKFGIPFVKSVQTEPAKEEPQGGVAAKKSRGITDEATNLYRHECPVCSIKNKDLDDVEQPYDSQETENWLKNVYMGLITPRSLDPILYERYAEILTEAVEKGYGGVLLDFSFGTPDYEMLKALKENIWTFSAAKDFQLTKAVNEMLFDEQGKKRDFNAFKKAVDPVLIEYNKNYLKTEYNTAIASAQQASKWVEIQKDKDILPLLKYVTVGDARVRYDHKILDGIIKPVSDSFWNKYYPPLAFNCRCTTTSLSEGKVTDTVINTLTLETNELIPKYFQFNCGKKKMVFGPKHPYFKVGKEFITLAEHNFNLPMPS